MLNVNNERRRWYFGDSDDGALIASSRHSRSWERLPALAAMSFGLTRRFY
jgi:hypothetical protein